MSHFYVEDWNTYKYPRRPYCYEVDKPLSNKELDYFKLQSTCQSYSKSIKDGKVFVKIPVPGLTAADVSVTLLGNEVTFETTKDTDFAKKDRLTITLEKFVEDSAEVSVVNGVLTFTATLVDLSKSPRKLKVK